jgi:hypothetical protein
MCRRARQLVGQLRQSRIARLGGDGNVTRLAPENRNAMSHNPARPPSGSSFVSEKGSMTGNRTLLTVAGFLVCIFSLSAAAQGPQSAAVTFTNVNVIPLDSERIEQRRTVLVRGDRIVAVGTALK